ncbi:MULTISPECIES: hypothetical protein [Burkholderia]|uniref:hypothetical protein n=1 Tax=Burkholderia TaxID=32008 RepID=UPI00210E11D3|nr:MULTISPECIES: hypothetical protein [Burkholderia]
MFLTTYAKRMNGEQNALAMAMAMARLESMLFPDLSRAKQNRRRSACFDREFWGG